jgi:hypothetical protein
MCLQIVYFSSDDSFKWISALIMTGKLYDFYCRKPPKIIFESNFLNKGSVGGKLNKKTIAVVILCYALRK